VVEGARDSRCRRASQPNSLTRAPSTRYGPGDTRILCACHSELFLPLTPMCSTALLHLPGPREPSLTGRCAQAARGAEKRQKGTVEYFDHLNSGADSNKLTEKDLENVVFATGAKGFDNTAILKKNDWKPVRPRPSGACSNCQGRVAGHGRVT
jgi:hypothetical protein